MKEPISAPRFYIFVSKKKNKNKKKICKKVDRKPERAVYAKGEPKENECEKMHKVD